MTGQELFDLIQDTADNGGEHYAPCLRDDMQDNQEWIVAILDKALGVNSRLPSEDGWNAYNGLVKELQQLCDEFGCLAGEHRISWLRKQLRSAKISVE